MRLVKWYADCVSPGGEVVIAYAARLGVGPFTLPYQAVLEGGGGSPLAQRWRLSASGLDGSGEDGLRWRWPRLGFAAAWRPTAPGIARVLLQTPALRVAWRCRVPRGDVRGSVDGRRIEGLGYAEELHLDGDPRTLPVRELRWGRFLSETDWLVWIDWVGDHPLTLVVHNGAEMEAPRVSDAEVSWPHGRLGLEPAPTRVLRDERADASAFPDAGWLRLLLPRSLAGLREEKWAAPGRVEAPGGHAPGWTVFERVTWP